ncbi:hypothetical protein DBZ36_05235 [Alginatibacterium sediminis]|uniref:Uncharacterized protein n=1 Tax=Alginatibacterium sediminis TaxID=2164068 RepID=A0A420EGR0_9ALTE|nr:hypothetical protein [Alginatibacterium sediminis]RKF19863.1 hypothetical protein DBZ36_05235 [Alginatibacterium sediminis]
MNTFDYAVLISAIAGLVMVVGGLVLIYKGALVLASTDSSQALNIEWKKDFRLSTQAPGIAFFIIGLAFSFISVFASKPSAIEPIKIEGLVEQISEQVTIRARSSIWTLQGGSNGVVKGRIHPHVEDIILEISAPGYKPEQITFRLSELKNRTVKFDTVNLEHKVEAIAEQEENIIDVPDELEPITSKPNFGAAQ